MRTESGNKLSYFPHLGLSGRQSRLDQNLTKLSPILSWPHCGTAAQTNKEKYSRKIKWKKILIEYNLPFCLWIIPHHSPWSSLWWQLRESVNFQRITNSKRILDSWFRNVLNESFLEKCNWNWENVTPEAFLQSLGWQSDEKEGATWNCKTFCMWIQWLDCGGAHVYLSLAIASALLFQLNVALLWSNFKMTQHVAQSYSSKSAIIFTHLLINISTM